MTSIAMSFRNVDLRMFDPWDPALILAPDPSDMWPVPVHASLDDLTTKVLPTRSLSGLVVRPADVDAATGSLTAHDRDERGWTYQVDKENLREGDILITASRPVVYITEALRGLQLSRAFLALRPRVEIDSLWLWACLNSSIGASARSFSRDSGPMGAIHPSRIHVPAPPPSWPRLRDSLYEIVLDLSADIEKVDRGRSWWRVTTLIEEQTWSSLMAAPDPSIFDQGERLGDLITSARSGRRPTSERQLSSSLRLPLWGTAQLCGRPVTVYADSESGVLANPGDVLIQSRGVRGLAIAVTDPCLVDSSLLVASLIDPNRANEVVSALNSVAGQRQRAVRAAGSTVPTLTPASLREIRLHIDESRPARESAPRPLATRIDELVWS